MAIRNYKRWTIKIANIKLQNEKLLKGVLQQVLILERNIHKTKCYMKKKLCTNTNDPSGVSPLIDTDTFSSTSSSSNPYNIGK